MRLSIKPQRELLFTAVLFYVLGINPSIAQSNAEYLKLLEGEAEGLTKSNKTTPLNPSPSNQSSSSTSVDTTDNGRVPLGLSFNDFINNLKKNYIGTYYYTTRLSAAQKNKIYTFYQNNNDPHAIRSQIIQIKKTNSGK